MFLNYHQTAQTHSVQKIPPISSESVPLKLRENESMNVQKSAHKNGM